jgi:endonuclease/exonuclease/phosphatase family metal-dependent hydrolase
MKYFALFAIAIIISIKGYTQAEFPMNVATYNLRYNNPGDGENAWPNRKDMVKDLIRYHEFDVFGTQEGLIDQLQDLAEMSEFSWYGRGRDDGKDGGEHSAIFYKKDRFQLLDKGDFWLSETPDEPTFGWDAACKRICSWVKLKDKLNQKEFYFFSVHFDHKGEKARSESGKLMVAKIKAIAGKTPAICVGDFNSTPDTEQIKLMGSLLSDSKMISEMPPYGPEGTANGFNLNAPLKKRIDYIFVSNDFTVKKYAVLTDSNNQRYPSDHQPVVARISFKQKE